MTVSFESCYVAFRSSGYKLPYVFSIRTKPFSVKLGFFLKINLKLKTENYIELLDYIKKNRERESILARKQRDERSCVLSHRHRER